MNAPARLREGSLQKAARGLKATTGVGCVGSHKGNEEETSCLLGISRAVRKVHVRGPLHCFPFHNDEMVGMDEGAGSGKVERKAERGMGCNGCKSGGQSEQLWKHCCLWRGSITEQASWTEEQSCLSWIWHMLSNQAVFQWCGSETSTSIFPGGT